ncbi:YciC family protein [Pantoea sp. Nvir]|uniref:YciC family protein n=1 Tax=Pantoea sp. Nvir TaxID=2576760 RepID=UPI001357467D|nr:YciC family protein [Pantoea sp. Nvir]MXP66695.1 UPF0259 family protein [Pantoea sp. Nvir]CAJ0991813.1 hypothetical protein NVIRPANT_00418 [Pantoea sp. Nvir]
MYITANLLYRDTGNFFRHQLLTIVLMSLMTAFITVILVHTFTPSSDQIAQLQLHQNDTSTSSLFELVHDMSPEKQRILLCTSVASIFSTLIGNTLLLGGMLCLITMVSSGHCVSVVRALGGSAPLLPKLLLQTFLITLVVQLGFMVLMLPSIIPAILLSLSPIILAHEKIGVIAAMRASCRLAWKNMKLIAPAIILWLLAKMAIIFASSSLTNLPDNVLAVVITTFNNIVFSLLIIYLFRLYMLVR